ncbi:DUF3298 and DUF4163 domain-containing protein [Priestia taiwanensis]|uniref:Ferritin n=1 Tax=Priestia taiwanensis TaxID=1347902 RepID=A0A917ETP2_9BACI|nr:DUF3298 and DUF4163 domain-containing protein [Priestia taiwanensis]MBM7364602.1 hypothetical protein [Priestia taiwanensis]GGE80215.1 ferritin [Priestia taiwanensis]
MLRKIIYALLCFFLFTSTASGKSDTPVSVTTKTESQKTPVLSYELNIPLFSRIKDEKLQRKLNKHMRNEIHSFKYMLQRAAKKAYIEANKNNLPFRPFEGKVTYQISLNKGRFLSFVLSFYQYTGGAHGMTTWKAYTIDIQNAHELTLEDLFHNGASCKTFITNEITKQIQENPSIYFPNAVQTVQQKNTFSFYLTEEGIVVFFPLYEIAPYSSGIRTFLIPYATCKPYVK